MSYLTQFKNHLLYLLLLLPNLIQAAPNSPAQSTHPTLPPPRIGTDGRLIIPTPPLIPRLPETAQEYFKTHTANQYRAELRQDIDVSRNKTQFITQEENYTRTWDGSYNKIANFYAGYIPQWPKYDALFHQYRHTNLETGISGKAADTDPPKNGDYYGLAGIWYINQYSWDSTKEKAFNAIYPDIQRHNRFADLLEQQGLTPEQAQRAFQQRDRAYNAMAEAERERLKEQRKTEIQQRQEQIDADRRADYVRQNFPKGVTPISRLPPNPLQPLPFEGFVSQYPDEIKRYVDTVDAIETTWDVVSLATGVPPVRKLGKELLKEGAEQIAKQGMKHLDDMAEGALKQAAKRGDDVVKQGAKRADDAVKRGARKVDDAAKHHPDNNFGKNNDRYNSDLQQKISNNNGTPTRSPEPLNNQNVQKIPTGRYPLTGQKPNVTLYHSDNGVVTNYATYDKNGMITKRVDMTGKAHGNMETPHVLDYGRNYAPDGSVYPHAPRGKNATRKPRPDELQYYKK